MQVDGIDPTEPDEHADPQGRGYGHPPSIEPSPLEDVRAEDAVIDANEPTPEDERVGADPATAATIFFTTIIDAVSFLMFLGLAA